MITTRSIPAIRERIVESLKCHFLRFGGEILCMDEEKMLGILMKQDQVGGKTKLISGKQDDCPTFK